MIEGGARLFLATSLCAIAVAVQATETTTYTYDALGRLVATGSSGTVNGGVSTAVGYDPAGNRSGYAVGTGGAPAQLPSAPPTGPPPPPPPSNQPPVTAADTLSVPRCGWGSKNVIANDSDPEGNTPLVVTAVSAGLKGEATVSGTAFIEYQSVGMIGNDILTYTVRDSLGATSTGTLTVTVTSSGSCA